MKNLAYLFTIVCLASVSVFAADVKTAAPAPAAAPAAPKTTPAPAAPKSGPVPAFVIDDFEDGNITANPEWWKFDRVLLNVVENKKGEYKYLGDRSLSIEGSTVNWYIGGMGAYFGIDGTKYDRVRMVVWGGGADSGTIKIELIDDDNRNWQCDINKAKGWEPVADDKFVYFLPVDWSGWKTIDIPFRDFEDENPQVGDNKWNPDQSDGSGGLLQFQMIFLSSKKAVGKINAKIDSIKLVKGASAE